MAAKSWDRPLEKTFCPVSGQKINGKVVPNHLMEVKHLTKGRMMFKCSKHSVRSFLDPNHKPTTAAAFTLPPGDKIVWAGGEPPPPNDKPAHDQINHPAHYGGDTTYEAIKVIEAWELGFCLGNTVKYISRAGKKDAQRHVQDLEKARWYLDREISRLKKEGSSA